MKILIYLLFLLKVSMAFAQEVPAGHFQVDSSSWAHHIDKEKLPLAGFISIADNFLSSRFFLQTAKGEFKSRELKGTPESFEVTGVFIHDGESKEVTLKGEYFGTIEKEEGIQKILIKLSSSDCIVPIFASRPRPSITTLHRSVQEIIQ